MGIECFPHRQPTDPMFKNAPAPLPLEQRQARIDAATAKMKAARAFAATQSPEETDPRGKLLHAARSAIREAQKKAKRKTTAKEAVLVLKAGSDAAVAIQRVLELYSDGEKLLRMT